VSDGVPDDGHRADMFSLEQARAALAARLQGLSGLVVAYSGGVDSSVLLAEALQVLGRERVVAAIADSPSLARAELDAARATAAALGAELAVLRTDELADPRYRANAGDRCYWCKEALFDAAGALADERGWALAYGENADDVGEHRPGARSAAGRGVLAPLRESGWSKEVVRAAARAHGLAVADKPASPCLASRLPVGVTVDAAALAQVEALEARLHERGFAVVRARHYGDDAVVVEIADQDLARARALETDLAADARACGYARCTLRAYRSGAVSV